MNRFFENGMDEISIDFSQGDEDELAVLNVRVGDLEPLGTDLNIIEKEDIQINRPGSPSKGFHPAQLRLDGFQCSKEFMGPQIGLDFYYPVDKPILRGVANGLRLKEGRFSQESVAVDS